MMRRIPITVDFLHEVTLKISSEVETGFFSIMNILTFDIEDWFHLLIIRPLKRKKWANFPRVYMKTLIDYYSFI